MKRSATQYSTANECPRKWWYPYIGDEEKEQTAAQIRGSEMHDVLERYVKGELYLDEIEDPYVHVAAADPFVKGCRVGAGRGEVQAELEFDCDEIGVQGTKGKIDVSGWLDGKHFILDYKTTKDFKWVKTEAQLRKDEQVHTYVRYAFERLFPHLDEIEVRFIYIHRQQVRQPRHVVFTVTRTENEAYWNEVLAPLDKQMAEWEQVEDVSKIPKDMSACGNFGGCPYQQICRMADGSRYSGVSEIKTRSTRMDMKARLEAMKNKPVKNPFQLLPADMRRLKSGGIQADDAVNVAKYAFNQGLDEVHDLALDAMNEEQANAYLAWRESQEGEDAGPPVGLEEAIAIESAGARLTPEQHQAMSQEDKIGLVKWRAENGAAAQPVNPPDAAPNHEPGEPVGGDGEVLTPFEKFKIPAGTRAALAKAGIQTFEELAEFTEEEVGGKNGIKGIGPSKVEKLKEAMTSLGLAFAAEAIEKAPEEAKTVVETVREKVQEKRASDGDGEVVVYVGCMPLGVETETLESICGEMAEDIVANDPNVEHWTHYGYDDFPKALGRVFEEAYKRGMIAGHIVVGDPQGKLVKGAMTFLYSSDAAMVVGTK